MRLAHRAGAGVGQEVESHVARRELEDVLAGPRERRARSSGVVIRIGSTILIRKGSRGARMEAAYAPGGEIGAVPARSRHSATRVGR